MKRQTKETNSACVGRKIGSMHHRCKLHSPPKLKGDSSLTNEIFTVNNLILVQGLQCQLDRKCSMTNSIRLRFLWPVWAYKFMKYRVLWKEGCTVCWSGLPLLISLRIALWYTTHELALQSSRHPSFTWTMVCIEWAADWSNQPDF